MKIVIDMNLSPQWVPILKLAGHEPIHWSQFGASNAPDREIMEWARVNNHVEITQERLTSVPFLQQPMPILPAYSRFVLRMYHRRHYQR